MPPFDVGQPYEPFTDFEAAAKGRYEQAFNLLVRKHHDYGPHAISRAPGGPLLGVAVRLHDKISRLAWLIQTTDPDDTHPNFEPLRDTLMDITNYGVIGWMVVDKKWPTE